MKAVTYQVLLVSLAMLVIGGLVSPISALIAIAALIGTVALVITSIVAWELIQAVRARRHNRQFRA